MSKRFLTAEQVYTLNEKHGYFQYADAQGDVSRDFAQDAIAMHERMRAAAPQMLAALQSVVEVVATNGTTEQAKAVFDALTAATGHPTGEPCPAPPIDLTPAMRALAAEFASCTALDPESLEQPEA